MAEYQIYCINDYGRTVSRHDYDAADALTALDHARSHCGKYRVQAWEGGRLVAHLAKNGSATMPQPSARPLA
jgi:hypothetical protein